MLKLIGSIIVIASASIMGFIYAKTFSDKVNQIRELQYALNMLENEITFTSTPLVQAFYNVAQKGDNYIYKLFMSIATILKEKNCGGVYDAFKAAYLQNKENLYFDNEEIEVMGSFMKALGSSDIEGQKKNFNITIKKLDSFEKKSEELRTKNEKLFRYLGMCTGALIVIILI